MYVCSRRYKVYVLTKILLTFKCICAQEDFTNFINFKCICAQEDYTFYQKFLGVPTLGVNTKTRRRVIEKYRGYTQGERRVLREEDQFQFYFYVLVLS